MLPEGSQLKLSEFEYSALNGYGEDRNLEVLIAIYLHCESLECLWILLNAFDERNDDYWSAVHQHRKTLKEFTHQEIKNEYGTEHGHYMFNNVLPCKASLVRMLRESCLESVILCCDPKDLVS